MIRDVLPRLDRLLRAVASRVLREESTITSVKVHPLALLYFENLEDQAALHATLRAVLGAAVALPVRPVIWARALQVQPAI